MAKSAAARSGSVRLYHHLRDRDVLTVVMLHRVLPQELFGACRPDPEYTISTALLEQLAQFFRANYTIVGLDDVMKARRGGPVLPARPLLLTFDDGWDDNARYAAPILARCGVPWTLFVAGEAPDSGSVWWQEALLKALRTGQMTYEALWQMLNDRGEPADCGNRELALLNAYGALDEKDREALLAPFVTEAYRSDPHMASWETLRALLGANVSVGAHGFRHLPLTQIDNPKQDLLYAREALRTHLGEDAARTLSFPHGRYDADILTAARALGFELMFTSDAILNNCPGGVPASDTLGRISIETSSVCDRGGALDSWRAERWLMLRKRDSAG